MPLLPSLPLDFEALLAAPGMPMLGAFPVFLSSLDASMRNLFAQVEDMGEQLWSSRLDLWLSVGVTIAGAAAALEITRRHARAPAPILDPSANDPFLMPMSHERGCAHALAGQPLPR
jgi:hypothetical protein